MKGDSSVLHLSDVLRAVLDYDGIDAAELARRMDRSDQVVRRWARGDAVPPVTSVLAIADALDAPVDVFVRPPATRDEVFARMLAHRAVLRVERGEP